MAKIQINDHIRQDKSFMELRACERLMSISRLTIAATFLSGMILTAGCGASNSDGTTLPPVVVAPPAPPPPPPPPPPPTGEISVLSGGVDRWFTVIRGEEVADDAPLVIVLHGGGGGMRVVLNEDHALSEWVDVANENNFVLIFPNGVNSRDGDTNSDRQVWNDLAAPFSGADSDADDVTFILDVINWADTNHNIDVNEVFVNGHSNGGKMTHRLLLEQSNSFKAGASISSNLDEDNPLIVDIAAPIPIMLMMGTADTAMPFNGGGILGGRQGTVRSAHETRDWWIDQNNAQENSPRTQLPDTDPNDGCLMFRREYAANFGGAKVVYFENEGGQHGVPSSKGARAGTCRDASGVRLAWDFFQSID